MFFGRIWAHVMRLKERTTQFKTGSTIAAIRGTELSLGVAVDGDETQLSVLEGQVLAQTDAGSLDLGAGQVAVGKKGKAPALGVQVRPLDAVKWALYYPPVLSVQARRGPRPRPRPRSENRSRPPRRATSRAPSRASRASTPRTSRTRGSSTIGRRCSSARARWRKRARTSSRPSGWPPTTATPSPCRRSWRSPGNQADKAVETAKRAVAAGPKSATAQIAQSYARQAKFDLEGARESLETGGDPRARRRAGVGPAGGDPLFARVSGARPSRRPRRPSPWRRTSRGPRRSWDTPT